ncbi:MAG: tryptophan-rich sensory protein [Anaerolineae bacterium]|nr:tryptophan-rich sensory protein [Anaerolineae bacterium]
MDRQQIRQVANVVTTLVVIVVNALANALPINNQTTGEISDRYPVLFTPAGYIFSIWGLIYLGLIAFSVYQAMPGRREAEDSLLDRIGWFYVVSGLANAIWIFLWHYEVLPLSLLVMLVLLGSLIAIYLRLNVGRRVVNRREFWAVHVPFSLYLGWITVATVANVAVVLYDLGWGGFGISQQAWTIIMLAVAAALAAANSVTRRDIAYNLVIVWAFSGIAVRQAATRSITVTVSLLLVVVVLALAASLTGGKQPAEVAPALTR